MVARKPQGMSDVEAASAPVVAVTAWQMLFDYAKAEAGQTVLVHGAAGNVGAYAVQLASRAGLQVIATASANDVAYVKGLGAKEVLDYRASRFENEVSGMDIVVDSVGGETRERSIEVLKPDGMLVSVVSPFPENQTIPGIRSVFFIVEVTTARLNALAEMFNHGELSMQVGSVLTLEEAQIAHEMLAGAAHQRGKIVLSVNAATRGR
jgi:NADPH:quinone reductase-like Zn-dependent oxidoreductase